VRSCLFVGLNQTGPGIISQAASGARGPRVFIITQGCADKKLSGRLFFFRHHQVWFTANRGESFPGRAIPVKFLCIYGEAFHDMITSLDPEGGS
jgi:hypothetical protein